MMLVAIAAMPMTARLVIAVSMAILTIALRMSTRVTVLLIMALAMMMVVLVMTMIAMACYLLHADCLSFWISPFFMSPVVALSPAPDIAPSSRRAVTVAPLHRHAHSDMGRYPFTKDGEDAVLQICQTLLLAAEALILSALWFADACIPVAGAFVLAVLFVYACKIPEGDRGGLDGQRMVASYAKYNVSPLSMSPFLLLGLFCVVFSCCVNMLGGIVMGTTNSIGRSSPSRAGLCSGLPRGVRLHGEGAFVCHVCMSCMHHCLRALWSYIPKLGCGNDIALLCFIGQNC